MRLFQLFIFLLISAFPAAQTLNPDTMLFSIPDFTMLAYAEVETLKHDGAKALPLQDTPAAYAGLYQAGDQLLIECFNGTGILLPKDVPLSSISKLTFHPSYYPFENTGLTYSAVISEDIFNELGGANEEMEGLGRHGKIEFFRGKGDLVLAYWNITNWFLVLESPRTMASLNLEMSGHAALGNADASKSISTGKPAYDLQESDYFLFNLVDGQCANIDEAIEQLSQILLIHKDRMDYSEESLDIIDNALYWNMNRANVYALSRCLTAYLGECIIRAKGAGWHWSEHVSIVDNKGNEIQFSGDIHKSTIDSDHGWSVKHVYYTALR